MYIKKLFAQACLSQYLGYLLQLHKKHFLKPKSIDIFLTSPQKHTLWYTLEAPCQGRELYKIIMGYPHLFAAMKITENTVNFSSHV